MNPLPNDGGDPYLERPVQPAPAAKSEFRGIFANAARAREVLSTHKGQSLSQER